MTVSTVTWKNIMESSCDHNSLMERRHKFSSKSHHQMLKSVSSSDKSSVWVRVRVREREREREREKALRDVSMFLQRGKDTVTDTREKERERERWVRGAFCLFVLTKPFLGFDTILGQESGLPPTANGGGEVVAVCEITSVKQAFVLQLCHKFWPLLQHPLIHNVAQNYGRLPTFCSFYFTEEKQLPWILWHLITKKRKRKPPYPHTHPPKNNITSEISSDSQTCSSCKEEDL